jgi:hypothetical protein
MSVSISWPQLVISTEFPFGGLELKLFHPEVKLGPLQIGLHPGNQVDEIKR